jgi:ribosomal protein S18 acetylase RimI-like enzyme
MVTKISYCTFNLFHNSSSFMDFRFAGIPYYSNTNIAFTFYSIPISLPCMYSENNKNMTLEIIAFKPEYSQDFYNLNTEWLEKYFYVEKYDEKVLSNPKKYIIDTGGYIFFIKNETKIIGTIALIHQQTYFELSKMAILPDYRGLKIGQQLIEYCIDFAKQKKWKSITLYSHKKLVPAINLYKKVGFLEIPLEKEVHYERANIKMILEL